MLQSGGAGRLPGDRQYSHPVVIKLVRKLPKDEANYGIIHGDLWLENILADGDSALTMIDWQDCEKHYYVYDLAVPIYSALEFSFAGGQNLMDYKRLITKAITDGYKEEHPLSAEMSRQLPLFLRLKELFEYNLMHMYWNHEELSEEQVRIPNAMPYSRQAMPMPIL